MLVNIVNNLVLFAIFSASTILTASTNNAEKMAFLKSIATCETDYTLIHWRGRSLDFNEALIFHHLGGTPITIHPRPPWLRLEDSPRGKTSKKASNKLEYILLVDSEDKRLTHWNRKQ